MPPAQRWARQRIGERRPRGREPNDGSPQVTSFKLRDCVACIASRGDANPMLGFRAMPALARAGACTLRRRGRSEGATPRCPRRLPVGGAGGPMFYALKVGPIETGEGPANAYLGFDDETGLLSPTIVERDDEAGLGQLLAGAPPGSALRCEPRLAKAGGRLGFEPAPL